MFLRCSQSIIRIGDGEHEALRSSLVYRISLDPRPFGALTPLFGGEWHYKNPQLTGLKLLPTLRPREKLSSGSLD